MRSPTRRRRTGGFSLIEMVLVVGGVTIIIGLAAGLLHLLLRLDRHGVNYLNDSMVISKLSDQFRADVRRAVEASIGNNDPPSQAKLVLRSPNDPTVTYSWEGKTVERTETLQGHPNHYESYHVERLSPIVFEAKDGYVAVVAGRTPETSATLFRSKIRIEARLGKTHGLGQAGEAKK